MHHKPLYLVAIPKGAIMAELLRLQKFISRRFRMYTSPYPDLHLTVGVIEPVENIAESYSILANVVAKQNSFSVQVSGERCFGKPFYSVGVAVSSQKLAHLSGRLEGALLSSGFEPRPFLNWDFHISLLTPLFARRQWTQNEYVEGCKLVAQHVPTGDCQLHHLELWDPDFPPLHVLQKFCFTS